MNRNIDIFINKIKIKAFAFNVTIQLYSNKYTCENYRRKKSGSIVIDGMV
jgi:hypothetical protein